MSVSLSDVIAGAGAHAVPLTAECAGYLVLAAADQAVLAPRRMSAADLELSDEGGIRVARSRACDENEAERDLRALLDELLLSASSVTPGLLRAGRRASSGNLAALLREIETALIPVNRAAARRALARLQRETARALEGGKIPRERRPDSQRGSRTAAALPPSVEVALAAIPTPVPTPAAPAALEPELGSEPASARPTVRPVAPVLSIPSDPVPPPTPRPQAKLAAEPVALPPVAPPPFLTPPPARVEAETRPEPVVVRASQRPPAAPATLPAPPPAAEEARPKTPVLGTVVAAREAPLASAGARDTLPAAPIVHVLEDGAPVEHDVHEELELVYLDEPDATELTEHCPPVSELDGELAELEPEFGDARGVARAVAPRDEDPFPTPLTLTERLALPIVPAFPRNQRAATPPPAAEAVTPSVPAVMMAEPEPPFITEPEPSPIAELARVAFGEAAAVEEQPIEIEAELISEVDLAVLVDEQSEPPVWAPASPAATELTPPPRHPLPKARQSDVSELIDRLGEAPLALDEIEESLKHLAGVEPTPPPFRVRPNE